MSAYTEKLLLEITELESKISTEPAGSRNIVSLTEQLLQRRKELTTANAALNEGASRVLKD